MERGCGTVIDVFGIGNPLIDIITEVADDDIAALGLEKGIMRLVDLDERAAILSHIEGRPIVYRSGGSCPNTLIFLSALGISCSLAGRIGNDEQGTAYSAHLPESDLRSRLIVDAEAATGTSIILVTPDTERTMNTYLGANTRFTRADLHQGDLAKAKMLHFTGYMWDTDEQKDAVLHAAEVVRGRGGKIVFDLADPFAVNRNRDEFRTLVAEQADIVFANAEEAGLLYPEDDAVASARRLAERCELAVVKTGAAGSVVLRHGAEPEAIPARKIDAVDTTGAGDMYAAGFLYGLLSGFSDREAGICASYLASRIVETFGAQFTPDKRAEVAEEVRSGAFRYTE